MNPSRQYHKSGRRTNIHIHVYKATDLTKAETETRLLADSAQIIIISEEITGPSWYQSCQNGLQGRKSQL